MSVPGTYYRARPTGRRIDIQVEEDTQNVLLHEDGRVTGSNVLIIPEDDFGAMKAGYICALCIEELDVAFPEYCPVCTFPMRAKQTEYIAEAYVGNMRTGPSTTLEEEALIMQEMRAKQARELGIWTPPSTWI